MSYLHYDPWYVRTLKNILWVCVWLGLLALIVLGVSRCQDTDWYKESQRKQAAEDRAKRTPRVYSTSPDGCTVYQFHNGDRWQYFTRCANAQTTTINTHTQSCGKACSRTVETPITAQ